MTSEKDPFAPFALKMREEKLPEAVISLFRHYYGQLRAGETGYIAESRIEPVLSLPDAGAFPVEYEETGSEFLRQTVVVKLNGGLGTSMGLQKAKSLLKVKEGLSFLEIAARQASACGVPLILMNSFHTQDDSLALLRECTWLKQKIPFDFLQNKIPKVTADDLSPATWPRDPHLEWCPPGHGDIYTALLTSGTLETLLKEGYRYAFVSNIDNLGAVIDRRILGYFVREGAPFLMEVSDRTPIDRKGGHLAMLPGGRLILRELAQCPPEDKEAFQGIRRHRYFNTNNIWLHLPALERALRERDGILGLAMIRNQKTIDPRDKKSPAVFQLETAMGSAISVFDGAAAVRVPRTRFAPVKKTGGLLRVRSDQYILHDDFRVLPNPERTVKGFVVDLDPEFYGFVDDMEARFPHGPPSLRHCEGLVVKGDVTFGKGVVLEGKVSIVNESGRPARIADGDTVSGDIRLTG